MPFGPIMELPPAALATALEWERQPALNPLLRGSLLYYPPGERAPDPAEPLREAKLVDKEGSDVVDKLFEILPAVSIAANLEYVAELALDGRKYTIMSATTGHVTIQAVRERDPKDNEHDFVRFREIPRDTMIDVIVEWLDLRPGEGKMHNMHVQDAREHNESMLERKRGPEHEQLYQMLSRPITGPAVEITVGLRDGNGEHKVTPTAVHIGEFDGSHYLTYTTGVGREARFWGGPATGENIQTALETLRRELADEGDLQ